MKRQTERTWIFVTLLLLTSAAARAQSTTGKAPSGLVAGDEEKMRAGASLQPFVNLGVDGIPNWPGSSEGLSSSVHSANAATFGFVRDAQSSPDVFHALPKTGTQEMLLALARESTAAGAQDDSKPAPALDTTAPEQAKEIAASFEGVVAGAMGDAVSQAVVTIKDSGGKSRTAVTDADGRFRMRRVEGENPPNANGSLEGIVTDPTGSPVAGAAVTIRDSEGRTITLVTSAEGKFRSGGLERESKSSSVHAEYKPNASVGLTKPAAPIVISSRVGFWALQGLMFGSAVAAVETTHNCLQANSCTAIPTVFQSRAAMYEAGLPVAAGIAILSYEMKRHGNHWWYLPPAILIGADTLLTVHSARASQ